jgi:hypothetical protein
VREVAGEEQPKLREDRPTQREHAFLASLPVDAERAALRVEVADLDPGQLASPNTEQEQAEQCKAVARVLGDREESRPRVSREQWSDTLLCARAPDPRGRRDRDVPLLLGPAPEGADDGRDLLARSWRALAPEVDDVGQVVNGDVNRLFVGEREAHTSEDGFVVSERRRSRAVLVSEPAQVAPDELAERGRAVRLVLHRLPDDPGGLAERQARVMTVRAAGSATVARVGLGGRGHPLHVVEERELTPRIELEPGIAGPVRHARRMAWRGRQSLANTSPPRPRIRGDGSGGRAEGDDQPVAGCAPKARRSPLSASISDREARIG